MPRDTAPITVTTMFLSAEPLAALFQPADLSGFSVEVVLSQPAELLQLLQPGLMVGSDPERAPKQTETNGSTIAS